MIHSDFHIITLTDLSDDLTYWHCNSNPNETREVGRRIIIDITKPLTFVDNTIVLYDIESKRHELNTELNLRQADVASIERWVTGVNTIFGRWIEESRPASLGTGLPYTIEMGTIPFLGQFPDGMILEKELFENRPGQGQYTLYAMDRWKILIISGPAYLAVQKKELMPAALIAQILILADIYDCRPNKVVYLFTEESILNPPPRKNAALS